MGIGGSDTEIDAVITTRLTCATTATTKWKLDMMVEFLDEDGNVIREWVDTPEDFGRIAVQTAKQVITQRLRDAKREQVFDLAILTVFATDKKNSCYWH